MLKQKHPFPIKDLSLGFHACKLAQTHDIPKDCAVVQLPQLVSRLLSADMRIPAFYRQDEGRAFPPSLKAVVIATMISLRPNPT